MSTVNLAPIFIFKYKDVLWEACKFGINEFSSDVNGFIYNIMDWASRNELRDILEIDARLALSRQPYHAYHVVALGFRPGLYAKQEHEIFKDYYQKTHEVAGVLLRPGSFFVAEAHQRINPRWAVIHEDNADRFYDEIIRPGTDLEL